MHQLLPYINHRNSKHSKPRTHAKQHHHTYQAHTDSRGQHGAGARLHANSRAPIHQKRRQPRIFPARTFIYEPFSSTRMRYRHFQCPGEKPLSRLSRKARSSSGSCRAHPLQRARAHVHAHAAPVSLKLSRYNILYSADRSARLRTCSGP